MKKRTISYFLTFFIVFILDRVTKYWVMNYLDDPLVLHNFFSFDRVINRGISWGMLQASDPLLFWSMSIVILVTIALLLLYAINRFKENYVIVGELLVLAGAISNIIDRFVYGGVVDFIRVSCGLWSFPVFNIADIAIVIGLGVMVIASVKE